MDSYPLWLYPAIDFELQTMFFHFVRSLRNSIFLQLFVYFLEQFVYFLEQFVIAF